MVTLARETGELPLIIETGGPPAWSVSWFKRPLDVALSSIGLLISLPLWLSIALAIKLEGGGRVFYGQERVGRWGRRFRSWKFRSMVPESDSRYGPLQARDGDDRVTRVGRIIRATALDELPQLWNIFKGDMSLVGPRALLAGEIRRCAGLEFDIPESSGQRAAAKCLTMGLQ